MTTPSNLEYARADLDREIAVATRRMMEGGERSDPPLADLLRRRERLAMLAEARDAMRGAG